MRLYILIGSFLIALGIFISLGRTITKKQFYDKIEKYRDPNLTLSKTTPEIDLKEYYLILDAMRKKGNPRRNASSLFKGDPAYVLLEYGSEIDSALSKKIPPDSKKSAKVAKLETTLRDHITLLSHYDHCSINASLGDTFVGHPSSSPILEYYWKSNLKDEIAKKNGLDFTRKIVHFAELEQDCWPTLVVTAQWIEVFHNMIAHVQELLEGKFITEKTARDIYAALPIESKIREQVKAAIATRFVGVQYFIAFPYKDLIFSESPQDSEMNTERLKSIQSYFKGMADCTVAAIVASEDSKNNPFDYTCLNLKDDLCNEDKALRTFSTMSELEKRVTALGCQLNHFKDGNGQAVKRLVKLADELIIYLNKVRST